MKTRVFGLFPINPDDPVWSETSYKRSCFAYAGDEEEARGMASAAFPDAADAWLNPEHTICREARLWGDPPPDGYRAISYDPV